MDDEKIRRAWRELDKLFGPDYQGRNNLLKNAAKIYAESIFEANDKDRIERIGKKHLHLVCEEMLDGKQFSLFLTHVIQYERFLKNDYSQER